MVCLKYKIKNFLDKILIKLKDNTVNKSIKGRLWLLFELPGGLSKNFKKYLGVR